MRAEISGRVFDSANAVASASTVNLWIDLACRAAWNYIDWPFKNANTTITTADGTSDYTMPVTDCASLRKVVNVTNLRVLRQRTERWLQNSYILSTPNPPTTQTGEPLFYVDGGLSQPSPPTSPPTRVVRLYPCPDSVYTLAVRYTKMPVLPSTGATPDNNYMPLPEDFDEAIIQWCLVNYSKMLDDPQGAQAAEAAYEYQMQKMENLYDSDTHETYPIVDVDETFWEAF